MTRSKLTRTLSRTYWMLGLVLAASLVAKIADHVPGLAGTGVVRLLDDAYDYMKDMSLVFVTVVAAYLASVFHSRSSFVEALRTEWRAIVASKSLLFAYTELERPTQEQYLAAFCKLSETIDNMRTVYRNVGETADLIGLYPYAPLHDMRRAFQTLDPAKGTEVSAEQRRLVRDAVLQSFYALREGFLDELDPAQPDRPQLASGIWRLKKPGATSAARRSDQRQQAGYDRLAPPDPAISTFLAALYEKEQTTAKPWREIGGDVATNPAKSEPMT